MKVELTTLVRSVYPRLKSTKDEDHSGVKSACPAIQKAIHCPLQIRATVFS